MEDRERALGDAAGAVAATSALLRVDAVLLLLLWAGAIAAWPLLPDPVPIHFDVHGRPDGWLPHHAGGFVVWLLLPAIATLGSLILRWAPRAARSNPTLWNIPHKREFLALDEAARAPIHERLERFLASATLLTTALMASVQAAIFLSATGRPVSAVLLVGFILLYCAVVLVLAVRSSREVAQAVVAAAAPGEGRVRSVG